MASLSRGMRIAYQHLLRLHRLMRLTQNTMPAMLGIIIDDVYERARKQDRHHERLLLMETEDEEAIARGEDPVAPRKRRRQDKGEVIRIEGPLAISLRRRAMEITNDPGAAESLAREVLENFVRSNGERVGV